MIYQETGGNMKILLMVLIGAVVTTLLQCIFGIDLARYPLWKQIVFRIVYMLWGAVIALSG